MGSVGYNTSVCPIRLGSSGLVHHIRFVAGRQTGRPRRAAQDTGWKTDLGRGLNRSQHVTDGGDRAEQRPATRPAARSTSFLSGHCPPWRAGAALRVGDRACRASPPSLLFIQRRLRLYRYQRRRSMDVSSTKTLVRALGRCRPKLVARRPALCSRPSSNSDDLESLQSAV